MRFGPENRYLNGIGINFNKNDLYVSYEFDQESLFFAIDVSLYSVLDPHVSVLQIELNSIVIKDSFNEERVTEFLLKNYSNTNQLKVYFNDSTSYNNELSSIIFLIFKHLPEDYYKNKELDNWF